VGGIIVCVKVIAGLGALHARLPMYNAQTVLEVVRFLGASQVALSGVTPEAWASGAWREQPDDDPLLFALEDARVPVVALGEDWSAQNAERAQMLEFLGQFPQGRERLRQVGAAERELRAALEPPQDAVGVHTLWLEAVRAYHAAVTVALEEGPGTAHRARRIAGLLEGAQTFEPNTVLIADLDDMPALVDAGLELPDFTGFQPGEASRFRAVVDRAYRLEPEDDLDALVHMLLALDAPRDTVEARIALEARFAASGLYLSVGDLESARDLLEAVSQGQFERPTYLPGYVLARLGQVRDLMQERDRAIGAYKAVLGLAYAPPAARETAQHGLEAPFQFTT
jgi:hypothetical protein